MTDVETLEERVDTVERAVTDGDHGFPAVDDLAELTERVESLESELAALNEHADELEAATQALRGYVGNVRSVNERVEGRADAALAATERLERRLDAVTDERRPADAGDTELRGNRRAEPRDSVPGEQGVGGRTAGLSGVDTDGQARAGNDESESSGRDPGVLEQIRSLL